MLRLKKWTAILLLTNLLLAPWLLAQRGEAFFAFVQNPSGEQGTLDQNSYKYQTAHAVFENLVRTRGDFRQKAPALVMNANRQNIAWMNPNAAAVGLEEKAYDVCRTFGSDSLNALAILLAHELTHYYEKHDWNRSFANTNTDLSTTRFINSLDESIKQETQADYIGGFLAFSAGYNVYGIMPTLLPKLYEVYGLPDSLEGYPALADRIKMSQNASNQLLKLINVYETAGLLTVLEEYQAAATYYAYILQDFQSREVYNNIGTNLAMAALSYYNEVEMPFVLPFELDQYARLNSLKSRQTDRLVIRERMFKEALAQFERAITLDPAYYTAYVNLISTHVLAKSWDDASYWLRKARKLDSVVAIEQELDLLDATMAALQGDSTTAISVLSRLAASNYPLGAVNLAILQDKIRQLPTDMNRPEAVVMDGIQLDRFLAAPLPMEEITLSPQVICGSKQLNNSYIRLHYANDGKQYTVVQWTEASSTDRSLQGIGIGSEAKEILANYGHPPRQLQASKGLLWVYPGAKLIFSLDKTGYVNAWGSYRKSE